MAAELHMTEPWPDDGPEEVAEKRLPASLVRMAKLVELERLREFGVFAAVPAEAAAGKYVLATKWEVALKEHGVVRARFVGRELRHFQFREDLFCGELPRFGGALRRLVRP